MSTASPSSRYARGRESASLEGTTGLLPESLTDADVSSPEIAPYRFGVDDFYRMIEMGFFADGRRVGLWDGQVYEQMAKKQPHSAASILFITTIASRIPPGWCLSVENPITLGPELAPLPDMAVLRGNGRDYYLRRPEAKDVGLVVELSDSSLRIDTNAKLAAYANAGIPTYWVVNLIANVIQVYEMPLVEEGRYEMARTFAVGTEFFLNLDGVAIGPIASSDLLPAP